MNAASLVSVQRALARRSGSRRRQWLTSLGAGALATCWIALAGDLALGSRRWLWVTAGLGAVAMLRIPFVLFWRPDAALLTRLPMRGRPLLDAALWASASVAAQALVPALLGAAALAFLEGATFGLVLRHVALAGGVALATATLIPAVGVAAGALVVSGKAAQLLTGLGEGAAPPTSWLGVLPGAVAAGVVLLCIDLRAWLLGGAPEVGAATPLLVGLAVASLAAALAARRAADRVVPAILRDVSALDRQRLAPLELTPTSAALRALGRRASPQVGLLVDKHARLMGRRHPMASVLGALSLASLASVALWAPEARTTFAAILALGGAYAWLLERRLHLPPLEEPRLLASLPISDAQIGAASRLFLAWWWGRFALLPGLAVVARTSTPLVAGMVLAIATGGLALLSGGRPRR
ncbi:MAG: hypothetical protein R3B48_09985 [Kofleriaceae bacterium]